MSRAARRRRAILWILGGTLTVSLSMPPFASAQDETPRRSHPPNSDGYMIVSWEEIPGTTKVGNETRKNVRYTYRDNITGVKYTAVVYYVVFDVYSPEPHGVLPVFAFASVGWAEHRLSDLTPEGSVARDPCQEEVDDALHVCVWITPWDPGWPQTSELLIDQADVSQVEREYRRIHFVLISGELDLADLNRLRSSTIRLRRALTSLLQRIDASPGADESERASALALATRWVRIAEAMTRMVEAYGESASRQR